MTDVEHYPEVPCQFQFKMRFELSSAVLLDLQLPLGVIFGYGELKLAALDASESNLQSFLMFALLRILNATFQHGADHAHSIDILSLGHQHDQLKVLISNNIKIVLFIK